MATSSRLPREINSYLIRLASADDAESIAAIYNQGMDERLATFETTHRTGTDIRKQLEEKADRFPTIVVVKNDRVVAFSTASSYRSRPCYAGIAEHSVYVDRDARQQGVGALALQALLDVYEERGFWKIVSRIFPENQASLRLHKTLGFRVVGVYERHGKLDNQWRDCVIVEKLLTTKES